MSSRMNRSILIKHFFFAALALCSARLQATSNHAAEANRVATGTWGGEHIILEVSKNGNEIEFDCARGQITSAMVLDKHGDFDVAGTFTPEHGGPVRRDEDTPPTPARYSGHVAGDTMSLTVTLGKENIGTYTLTFGSHPNLRKCR